MLAFNFRQNSKTFDTLHAFLSLVVAKLSDVKNSTVFGPPCIRNETFLIFAKNHRPTNQLGILKCVQ